MSLAGGTRGGRAVHRDVRDGLLGPWPGVVAASLLALVGHVATFLVAARTAGVTAPLADLLPLALLVLVAMGIPANVAGWGPREGVAAWASARRGWAPGRGWPPPSCTASWCSSRACRASSSCWPAGPAPGPWSPSRSWRCAHG